MAGLLVGAFSVFCAIVLVICVQIELSLVFRSVYP